MKSMITINQPDTNILGALFQQESAFKLMKRMWDQGTEFVKTKKALKNLYTNHLSTLNKFYETSRSFCKVLLFGVPD